MTTLIAILGWIGMALIVSAFFLVSHGKIDPKGRSYQFMNVAGSVGIAVDVWHDRSWPAFVLQIVWILVALSALARSRKRKKDAVASSGSVR